MKNEKLYVNGNIYTMTEAGATAEALGISKGKISYVGNLTEEVLNDSKKIIDLKGKTVLPGFIDSHMHLGAGIIRHDAVDLGGCHSIREITELCKKKSGCKGREEFIYCINYNENVLEDNRDINKKDLEKICNPVIINSLCLHKYILNEAALKLAGIDGHNGIFKEKEVAQIKEVIKECYDKISDKKQRLKNAVKRLNKIGVTTVNTFESTLWSYYEDIDDYIELEERGELSAMLILNSDDNRRLDYFKEKETSGIKAGWYKIYIDGSLGSQTAYLRAPYENEKRYRGFLWNQPEEVYQQTKIALDRGYKVAYHAIGDGAFELVMDVIEKYKMQDARIIHAQILGEDLLQRAVNSKVYVDIQPHFIHSDMDIAERNIGKDRLKYSYCYKTMLEKGMLLSGGSDWPADENAPLYGIYSAVTQQNDKGLPWKQNQRLDIYDAISLYTKRAAETLSIDDKKGTLEIGKDGDMVLLDKDPFKEHSSLLKDILLKEIIFKGSSVYKME